MCEGLGLLYNEKERSRPILEGMNDQQAAALCNELRRELIQDVAVTGGHLASNLGAVELTGPGEITPHDRGVVPYDYTVYSSVLCAESMRFYWLTYRNSRVRYVELSRLLKGDRPLQFALGEEPEFCDVTGEGV